MSAPRRTRSSRSVRARRPAGQLSLVPPLAEQVEAWVSALLAPRPLRAENALALARHALHPVDASVALELAWGEGRTHLAPRWAPQALCGASLGASGTRGVAVTCGTCAGLLPPEAD